MRKIIVSFILVLALSLSVVGVASAAGGTGGDTPNSVQTEAVSGTVINVGTAIVKVVIGNPQLKIHVNATEGGIHINVKGGQAVFVTICFPGNKGQIHLNPGNAVLGGVSVNGQICASTWVSNGTFTLD